MREGSPSSTLLKSISMTKIPNITEQSVMPMVCNWPHRPNKAVAITIASNSTMQKGIDSIKWLPKTIPAIRQTAGISIGA